MSIYDNAGVVLIPSGTKASKLYSVLPANGNGDFTHSRGSTATRVNIDGLIESVATNVPRLDYPLIDGVVQDCPALLLEPQRTNELQRTEEFDNSYWSKSNSTITANQAISPDGSQTADIITKNADYGLLFRSSISISSGSNYTLSIFVKKSTTNFFSLRQASGSYDVRKQFNLTTKEVSNGLGANQTGFVSSEIKEYPNDWYRISITCTSNGTLLSIGFYSGKVGESTNNGNTFIWGAQLEGGSYQTSYIPWDGSGTTTRSADVCNGSGTSAEFNDSKGVLFAELQALDDIPSANGYVSFSDGTSVTNAVLIQYRNNGDLRLYNGGTATANMIFRDAGATLTDNLKIATKYGTSTSDYKVYINGFSKTIETAFVATSMSGLDSLQFAFSSGTSNVFEGKCEQLMNFKTALTDSELETLTSWDSFNAMAKGQLYTIE
jgi:hypothetical protein